MKAAVVVARGKAPIYCDFADGSAVGGREVVVQHDGAARIVFEIGA